MIDPAIDPLTNCGADLVTTGAKGSVICDPRVPPTGLHRWESDLTWQSCAAPSTTQKWVTSQLHFRQRIAQQNRWGGIGTATRETENKPFTASGFPIIFLLEFFNSYTIP